MTPAPVSLSWAPGVRLVTSTGECPEGAVDILPTLPPPFLQMFFSAHHRFTDRTTTIAQDSTEYQAMMQTCFNSLHEFKLQDELNSHQYDALIDDVQHAINVWSFIHAVYIMSTADRNAHISRYLSDWYRDNYPPATSLQNSPALTQSPSFDRDQQFWTDITNLILRGDFNRCRQSLAQLIRDRQLEQDRWRETTAAIHLGQYTQVPENVSPFILIESILEGAPDHNLASRADNSWATWQDACDHWVEFKAIEDCLPAQAMLRVLAGEPAAIAEFCTSWEQMLATMTLYLRDDMLSGGNLQGGLAVLKEACAHASMHFKPPSHIAGGALLEAALGNLKDAVVRVHATLPSSWFSAHLCDLLVRGDFLQDATEAACQEDDRPIGMREFYLKQFASSLERYRGCWRLAVDYFSACPTHGTGMIMDMFARMPLHGCGDPIIEKMLWVCKRKKLRKTADNICERVGVICLHHDNLGGAMAWFARGRLTKRCCAVADLGIMRAERGGPLSAGARTLECVAVALGAFGTEGLLQKLDFVNTYYEMQEARAKLKSAKENDDALDMEMCTRQFVSCVRSLVDIGGIERRFWCVIAYEAALLFEMYPDVVADVSRRALLDVVGALELTTGPFRSVQLLDGLRRRVAADGASAGEVVKVDVKPCSVDKVESVLDHCRKVLVQCLARKINES